MTGVELIAQERQRQVEAESWTPDHDDTHDEGELVEAAITYAALACRFESWSEFTLPRPYSWPWDAESLKPSDDPIRNLVKAGALIAAEIDRLQRRG